MESIHLDLHPHNDIIILEFTLNWLVKPSECTYKYGIKHQHPLTRSNILKAKTTGLPDQLAGSI